MVNYGEITLAGPGGYAALLGSSVKNVGTITAELGTVALAAGEKITLNLDPLGLISAVVNVETGTKRNDDNEYAAVNNRGTIRADGGKVVLSAKVLDSVFKSAVNNDGVIEAYTIGVVDGQVLLKSNQNIELNGEIYASGTIDAYADENIFLGLTIEDLMLSTYEWNYIDKDTRTYKFKEFGYYYADGNLKIVLAQGEDIGKDVNSPLLGFGFTELPGDPQGLYIVMDPLYTSWHTLYEDSYLNPDGLDHVNLFGTEYWWEDIVGLGDADFDDVIVDFRSDLTSIKTPDAILDSTNIFLTANNGFIQQNSGEIKAVNLMLETNAGMSGTGNNGGLATIVKNVSALNKASGNIRIDNQGTLTVADLHLVEGLNTEGVGNIKITGYDGITNLANGGEVNIEVAGGKKENDLNIEAPVNSSGPVIFKVEDDITHTALGDVTVHNTINPPGVPENLISPSHTPGEVSEDRTVEVAWELPDNTPGYGVLADAGGSYTMAIDSEIVTNDGNVDITANGDVSLSLINAGNGNVKVTSSSGSIKDADLGIAPNDYDVIGHNILLSAAGSIGGNSPAEIDLGHPYDFSHLWDNADSSTPDTSKDSYDETYNSVSGDWSFSTVSDVLADGSWWFHVRTLGKIAASSPSHIGPFIFETPPPPPPDDELHWQAFQETRIYYEILDPSRFLVYEPAQQLGLYAYHPISSADMTAFDDIRLDSGAYEFISDNIEMKKKANPYFGLE